MAELLVGSIAGGSPLSAKLADRIESASNALHAPHLIDLEVASVLRSFETRRLLSGPLAMRAMADLAALDISRYAHERLLPRIWQLRGNLTVYDAAYVALAEILDLPLVTCDRRLAKAPGNRARVELFA